MKKINLEDNSEEVRIGKVLHESMNDSDNSEVSVENIKVDKITNQYVVEIKKSDADLEAATKQVEYYMYILNKKGIRRDGRIEVLEKNKQNRKIHYIEYSEDIEKNIENLISNIEDLYKQEYPPEVIFRSACKKCAYYEYCNL